MRSCVLSRYGGGGGEASRGKGEMESQLRLMGNDTDLVEGGKKEDLSELRKGQQQRCDEIFPDLMDWEDASP
jgi:CRISPR/Cas system CMR-associated protein Cmr1 (group 7 of RAMP superfamily)